MILIISTQVLGTELRFPQEVYLDKQGDLYKPRVLQEDKLLIAFTTDGAIQIGKINLAYLNLLDLQSEYEENINSLKTENKILDGVIVSLNRTIDNYKILYETSEIEREDNLTLYLEEKKARKKEEQISKIKTILFCGASGIVGIGIGMLIGVFLIN